MTQQQLLNPLARKLFLAEQVRKLDKTAIEECNIPGRVLMKRAGRECFEFLLEQWPNPEKMTVFCGGGNNGGDGYVIAALAAQSNIPVQVLSLVDPMTLKGDAALAFQYALQENVEVLPFSSNITEPEQGVIVDALLGTGLSGAVKPEYRQAIDLINGANLSVMSVDIPSGICADTGAVLGCAVKAQATATFIGMKFGLTTGLAVDYVGELRFFDLQVPAETLERLTPFADCLNLDELLSQLSDRAAGSHKGDFGHLLVIGGAEGMGGAALMAAEVSVRLGAGRVSAATHGANSMAFLTRVPEVMARSVSDVHEIAPLLEQATAIAIGPGLGQTAWSEQMFQAAVNANKPLIIDADGLNLLARDSYAQMLRSHQSADCILTPHPGEAARLLGVSTADIQNNRYQAAQQIASKYRANVVLKGAGTLVVTGFEDDQAVSVCRYGNPGMASGGMGDVLTGVVASLVSQGFEIGLAVKLGVSLHSVAADRLANQYGERGLLATDLIPVIRTLLNNVDDSFHD